MDAKEYLDGLLRIADQRVLPRRIEGWKRVIRWSVDGDEIFWTTENGTLAPIKKGDAGFRGADFTLTTTVKALHKIVEEGFPFFLAIWGTGEIQFDCSFGDAYRLGYIFLRDKRRRRVVFISHCWLNINARFPEGAAFEGANTALMGVLLEEGLGIIQMPCPEYLCLGLEKYDYGKVIGEELTVCFRKTAETVVSQVKDHLSLGFEVVGIMGMDPSPSCGVKTTKGRGTMEGTDTDTVEKPGPGIFIEELQNLLRREGLEKEVPIFGIRRILTGETGLEDRVAELKRWVRGS
jgi:predicted secreted protein